MYVLWEREQLDRISESEAIAMGGWGNWTALEAAAQSSDQRQLADQTGSLEDRAGAAAVVQAEAEAALSARLARLDTSLDASRCVSVTPLSPRHQACLRDASLHEACLSHPDPPLPKPPTAS